MQKLNLIVPQWQGGGQDLSTYYGAKVLTELYLSPLSKSIVPVSTDKLSPKKNGIWGYDDILQEMKSVKAIIADSLPEKIFTVGGGCDSDPVSVAYLNEKCNANMAVVYLDAHADLNTPESSVSGLYYGMSLRAVTGDTVPEIREMFPSLIGTEQLIMGGNRCLDPEEIIFKQENGVSNFSVEELTADPGLIAKEILRKKYDNVYIHIDLDVLDPEEFPMVPVPETNGLSFSVLSDIMESVKNVAECVGFAILEYDGSHSEENNEILKQLIQYGLNL